MTENYSAELRSKLERQHAIQRFANPDEIVKAVAWLCSPDASFVHGHNLVVDGGYTIQ